MKAGTFISLGWSFLTGLVLIAAALATALLALITVISTQWLTSAIFLYLAIALFLGGLNQFKGAASRRRNAVEYADVRREYSGKDYFPRPDWLRGESVCDLSGHAHDCWAVASVFNFFLSPLALYVPHLPLNGKLPYLPWLGYGFLAAGIWFTVRAIKASLFFRRLGNPVFRAHALPVRPGQTLSGHIEVPGQLRPDFGFLMILRCLRKVTASGEHSKVSFHIRYEDSITAAELLQGSEAGISRIPVIFNIPESAQETFRHTSSTSDSWLIRLEFTIAGKETTFGFAVPVRKDSEQVGSKNATQFDHNEIEWLPEDEKKSLQKQGVIIQPAGGDITEVIFRASRNLRFLFNHFIATFISGGIFTAVMFIPDKDGWTWFFVICMGFATFWNLMLAIKFTFGTTVIRIKEGEMEIQRRLFGWMRKRIQITLEDLSKIYVGDGYRSGNYFMHEVRIDCGIGSVYKAGTNIKRRREAEWLATEMMRLVLGEEADA